MKTQLQVFDHITYKVFSRVEKLQNKNMVSWYVYTSKLNPL